MITKQNTNLDLSKLQPPDYADDLLGSDCRLLMSLEGVDLSGLTVTIPVGSIVTVIGGEYLDCPKVDDDCYRFRVEVLDDNGAADKYGRTCDGVANTMLAPEPGIAAWSSRDSASAIEQGWEIFYCSGSSGSLWQLQCVAESDIFTTDMEAWSFVWKAAIAHDDLAKKALSFLYYRSPREYADIRKYIRAQQK